MSTAADVVKWVDPDAASLPSAPVRRILVRRRVDGVERRLYDMPWRTHPDDDAPLPFYVVQRAPQQPRRTRHMTGHLEEESESVHEETVLPAPEGPSMVHEDDDRRPRSTPSLTPPP